MRIEELRAVFLVVYLIFMIWTLVDWAKFRGLPEFRVRYRAGEIGLIVGSISAGLFTGMYLYLLIAPGRARGLTLWCLVIFGEALALLGLLLGMLGAGWIRKAASLISLVIVFYWLREMVTSAQQALLVDVAMGSSLSLYSLVSLGYQYRARHTPHV